jgi:hypothetical protein
LNPQAAFAAADFKTLAASGTTMQVVEQPTIRSAPKRMRGAEMNP